MSNNTYNLNYNVESSDFTNAGTASREIKKVLVKLGIPNNIVRRVSIATYEAEMNLAIHSFGGYVKAEIFSDKIKINVEDIGPGIENIDLAMTEGYSTASQEAREIGFGAGMGLPNMKLNADEFNISSQIGIGTKILMTFNI